MNSTDDGLRCSTVNYTRSADVCVFGAGPAGCATAKTLLRNGHSVVLLHRTDLRRPITVGECLPGAAKPLIAILNIEEAVSGGHSPYVGNEAIWGSDGVETSSCLFSPYGVGWHLDRPLFNTSLIGNTVLAGATLMSTVGAPELSSGSEKWHVVANVNGQRTGISAKWIVDCTGRAAFFARRLCKPPLQLDRLVAWATIWNKNSGGPETGMSSIEARPEGWWYSATLSSRRRIVVFHSDIDLCRPARPQEYLELLDRTELIRWRLRDYVGVSRPHPYPCHTTLCSQFVGARWAVAGDVSLGADPLSSSGLLYALSSGYECGVAISGALTGRFTGLEDFREQTVNRITEYTRAHRLLYGRVHRFSNSAFWLRRCGPSNSWN